MLIRDTLNWAIGELKKNDISEAERSATLLLMDVLGEDRAYLYSHGESELTVGQLKKYKKCIERRKSHEPVWYIIGKVKFYGREFLVNNDVMTPRPETEFLVREILQILNPKSEILNKSKTQNSQPEADPPLAENNQLNIIELGTGSGIIAITLAKELAYQFSSPVIPDLPARLSRGIRNPEILDSRWSLSRTSMRGGNDNKGGYGLQSINFIATDISGKALDVAKKNAILHGVSKEIQFLKGDLLEPINNKQSTINNSILVANLPYIPHEDMDSLQFDVQHHEPRVALDGGKDGLEIYERLIKQMKNLNFSGAAFFEIGKGQGKLIKKIVQKLFPKAKVEVRKDLSGIDRIAVIDIQ